MEAHEHAVHLSDEEDAPGEVIVATASPMGNSRSDSTTLRATLRTSSPGPDPAAAASTAADRRRPSVAESHESEPPAKKMKRGKYISRACTSCQRRKIKCEGGDPCAQCKAKNRVCISTVRGQAKNLGDTRSQISGAADGVSTTSSTEHDKNTRDLMTRVADLERRLSNIQDAPARDVFKATALHQRRDSTSRSAIRDDDAASPDTTRLQRVLETNGQSFMGEFSLSPGFDGPDKAKGISGYSSPDATLVPHEFGSLDLGMPASNRDRSSRKVRGWFESVLEEHGVVADEAEWRKYMHLFFDEIHVLYPILHPPSVWEVFEQLWEYSALWSMADVAERARKRRSAALVCFCLALGRCCVSTRMTDSTGVHSSGWSLYSVGVSLIDDSSKTGSTAATSLLSLQLLLLKFIYLFRLDATQEAARIIALAISNAYIVGIHRQSTLDAMSCFRAQLFCRIWWSIFILDRRTALESGRPYLIQESISNAELPLELSDKWLSKVKDRPETMAALKDEIAAELAMQHVTTLPYINAMVRYSRIASKAWDLIYGIKASSNLSSSHMVDYADTILCGLLETSPRDLAYDPSKPVDSQFSDRPRWKIKQTMLLFTCVTNLRILIRKPTAKGQPSPHLSEVEQFESLTICASLAASVLNGHRNLRDSSMKHCFPYCHYLMSCTMVMVSLVARAPSLKRKHAETILAAIQSLRTYCHTIWVSGKMVRWVSRITVLANRLLQDKDAGETDKGDSKWSHAVDGPMHLPDGQDCVIQQSTPHSENDELPQGLVSLSKPMNTTNQHARLNDSNHHHVPSLSLMAPMVTEGGIPHMPEWVMSDFNFELISTDDLNHTGKGLDPCLQNPEEMGQHGEFHMDMEDSLFGTLSSGLYNFDVAMS